MHLSKMELFALIVALFVGLHFYNQHKLESENFEEGTVDAPMYLSGDNPPVIVAFGDGITAGSGAPKEESYPAQLSRMLGIEVINAGSPRETSTEALRRLPQVLNRYKPNIVIIEVGMADVLTGRKRAKIKENLEKMVELVKQRGAKPVIIGVPDMDLIDLMISSDIGLYEEVAQDSHAIYIPNVIGPVLKDESLKSSESYPNAEGYKQIARKIYDYLGGTL
ncbi:GDSL-type esterase/lipase family protein [Hydrogenimonas sp.]